MTNQEYKDIQKRTSLMQVAKWCSVIAQLKQFKPLENKDYKIVYRNDNHRKDRSESFEKVQYIEDTHSFVFNDGYLFLKDIDIIDINVSDKIKPEDYIYNF